MEKPQSGRRRDSHLLFLSHAGADTEAAQALAERIERTPAARERGLTVWFDKKDLEPGRDWQAQLEQALVRDSTAFAVYVGSKGVINWVESEVRVALSRARSDPDYPFIPILSKQCSGSEALPAFARQYQGVIDVESNSEELAKLIRAATAQERRAQVRLVDEPFLGLRAFEEKDTHLFFGRDEDADQLIERLRKSRLLMAVGDSGSGKSSLVKAGLVPRYRGGALVERRDPRADTTVWQVVETRPRSNPFDSLADSVATGARAIGRSQDDVRALRNMVRDQDPQEVADALRDGAPEDAKILVVVDQFEELFTLSDRTFRQPYIDTLLYLTRHDSPAEFRIVLTMRRDYYNLCHEYSDLYAWLEDRERGAKFSVRRMADEQLRSCIEKPLTLTDVGDTDVFVERVLADVGDQPGELALLEMALTESWRRRNEYGGDMLQAYTSLGGTAGALANVADEVFGQLDPVEQALAKASLIRLVRLGETGGTTRRVASRDEFSEDSWRVLQKLARQDYARLIYIGGFSSRERFAGGVEQQGHRDVIDSSEQSSKDLYSQQAVETAELSHEALASQWPRYQNWLQAAPMQKRHLDALMLAARNWRDVTPKQRERELLAGSRLEEAIDLVKEQASWLSADEREFVKASCRRAVLRRRVAQMVGVLLIVAVAVAVWFAYDSNVERAKAVEAEATATKRLKQQLWQQGVSARDYSDEPLKAAHYFGQLITLSSPGHEMASARIAAQTSVLPLQLREIFENATSAAFSSQGTRIWTWGSFSHQAVKLWDSRTGEPVREFGGYKWPVFNKSRSRVLISTNDGTARVLDAESGEPVSPKLEFPSDVDVLSKRINKDGSRVITRTDSGAVHLWDVETGRSMELFGVQGTFSETLRPYARFNGDGRQVLTWGAGHRSAMIWRSHDGFPLATLSHSAPVKGAAYSLDDRWLLTWADDGACWLWDSQSGQLLWTRRHSDIRGAVFDQKGTQVLSFGRDKAARLWDVRTGKLLTPPFLHQKPVEGAIFNPDGTRLLTWMSRDTTVRLWNTRTGQPLLPLRHGRKRPSRHGETVVGFFDKEGERIITWGVDGSARTWDGRTGAMLTEPMRHHKLLWGAMPMSHETLLITWSTDDTARIWDTETGAPVSQPLRHDGDVSGVAVNPDGTSVLTWGRDDTVRLWSIESHRFGVPFGHEKRIEGVSFDQKEARVLTWSADTTARVWDSRSGAPLTRPLLHKDAVKTAAFSIDGERVLTFCKDGTLRVWDSYSGEPLTPPERLTPPSSEATFNENRTQILTYGDMGVLNIKTEKQVAPRLEFRERLKVSPSIFSRQTEHDSKLWNWLCKEWSRALAAGLGDTPRAVCSRNAGRILLWDAGWSEVRDRQSGRTLVRNDESPVIGGAAISADGSHAITWAFDGFRIWDTATGKQRKLTAKHRDGLIGAQFNRDSSSLLTWSRDDSAKIWTVDIATAIPPPLSLQHSYDVNGGEFSRDGVWIVTWSSDGSARMWESKHGRPISPAFRQNAPISGAILNGDNTLLVTWSESGTARIWNLPAAIQWPSQDYPLKVHVETGTRLTQQGNLEVIPTDEWRHLRREYVKIARQLDD